MDGKTWTDKKQLIDAIDSSQDNGGGMVTLSTHDPEDFEMLLTELVGICSEQGTEQNGGRVCEFKGWTDAGDPCPSRPWAIQLCLLPQESEGCALCGGFDIFLDCKRCGRRGARSKGHI